MQKLKAEPDSTFGALLLSSQCSVLGDTMRSRNRFLIKPDDLVDLLVQHAELSLELVSILYALC